MFAANAEFYIGPSRPATLNCQRHQLADPIDIEANKWIAREDALFDIGAEELGRVISRDTQRCLRQVIGAERKELTNLSDFSGHECSTRQFDHGPDMISQGLAALGEYCQGRAVDQVFQDRQFLAGGHQWHHHFWHRCLAPGGDHVASGLEQGTGLHLVDLGESNSQPATTMPQHRIELVQFARAALERVDPNPDHLG